METSKITSCLAIPTYNREEVLIHTLQSAFALEPKPDEILVIDQTPSHEPETTAFLQAARGQDRIRWVQHSPPSLTAARNRAIAETTRGVIIFIDDDVELPRGFVARHLVNYQDEKVAAVAGGVSQDKMPRLSKAFGGHWPRIQDYKYLSVFADKREEGIANFMGCNHSARVEVLRGLGGYDTHYIGSALREDSDMAIRIWKSGGLIVFDPEARLHHLAAPTGGCRINSLRKANPEWWVGFNRNYFAFRHFFPTLEFWWLTLFKDQRESVLRKANLRRPWVIPWALLSYGYSVLKAGAMVLRGWRNEITDLNRA